jgi:hypothetical protein
MLQAKGSLRLRSTSLEVKKIPLGFASCLKFHEAERSSNLYFYQPINTSSAALTPAPSSN